MSAENKAIVYRWFDEVWNQGRLDVIDELLAENAIAHGLQDDAGTTLTGPAVFRNFVETFRAAFPDIKFVVEDVVAEDDRISSRCTVTGTHLGEGFGLTPTYKPFAISGITMARIENGKIAEGWNVYDLPSLFKQIEAD